MASQAEQLQHTIEFFTVDDEQFPGKQRQAPALKVKRPGSKGTLRTEGPKKDDIDGISTRRETDQVEYDMQAQGATEIGDDTDDEFERF